MNNFNSMKILATNKLQGTKLYTGFMALVADATKALIGVTGALTLFLIIFNLLRMKAADDTEKPKYKKNAISTLIIGIIVLVAEGVLAVVFSYFQ